MVQRFSDPWRGGVALLAGLLSCLAALAQSPPARADAPPACELDRPVVFAGMDWASNDFHNAVAGFILQHGYGCRTDRVPGSTITLLTGLARGDVDVAMEIWKDNVTEPWNRAKAAGQVVELGTNFPDAVQGWYVPRYLVEGEDAKAPELRKVEDLRRYKDLFRDPEEPGKGRFYNCILGWNCEIMNTKKLEAYGLSEHFTNFRPGSGAALAAAIASNYKRRKPFLAYYWGPTWVLGKYDLVMLEEPPYEKAAWEVLRKAEHPTSAVAYPVVEVVVGANAEFPRKAPRLAEFLSRYETTAGMVSRALAEMQESRETTAEGAARHFLRSKPAVWSGWVPEDVAARVRAALN